MQIERNKWVEDVLSSADNVDRAPVPDMTARVQLLAHIVQMDKENTAKTVWRMAASVALLIGLNLGSLLIYNSYHPAERGHQNVSSILGVNEHYETDLGSVFFGN